MRSRALRAVGTLVLKREVDVPVAVLRERLGDRSFTCFFAYPYMLRRSMVLGNDDLQTFKGKPVTFVRTTSR